MTTRRPSTTGPERDVFRPGDILGIDDQHELAHLLGPDGRVGHQQRILGGAGSHLDARKHARRERSAFGLANTARARMVPEDAIDGVVDEVQPALVGERRFVDQLELDRHGQAAVGCVRVVVGEARVAQIGGLIHRELEADGIDRFDGGKQAGIARRSARDEIADGHAPVADASGNRGAQLGELEIELGLAHGRLLRRDRRLGHALGLRALIECLLGDDASRRQDLAAREIAFREGEVGSRLREAGLRSERGRSGTAGDRS